ncbi:MAG: NifB/NifX family molybdenum-iron cluster-binding protein [Thermotogaceae bacterium]|nr:NifB/NifX family molybdenum-iron cluster-binding protein [Thermotogaceae bacterium]
MRIALPSKGGSFDSPVNDKSTESEYFLIYNIRAGNGKIVVNRYKGLSRMGSKVVQMLKDNDSQAVITFDVGQTCDTLKSDSVGIFAVESKDPTENLKKFKDDKLRKM